MIRLPRRLRRFNPFSDRSRSIIPRSEDLRTPRYWFAPPVEVAVNQPLVLSGLQTIHRYDLAKRARVLVNGQADPTQNGIYVVTEDAWRRTNDLLHARPISVYIQGGRYKGYVALLEGLGKVEVGKEPIHFKIVAIAQ